LVVLAAVALESGVIDLLVDFGGEPLDESKWRLRGWQRR
jgi:hypothetical protein